jgi:hypothetical protein
MTIANIRQLVKAELDGQVRDYHFRKVPSQTTQASWFDLSLSAGNPPPKYWFDSTPAVAKAISQSADGGFYHGANVSPQKKFLRSLRAGVYFQATVPAPMILCDYLLYYPTLDDGTTSLQTLDNTVTIPRYTDGAGVQMIMVSLAGRNGGSTYTIKYTNSDGVANRTATSIQMTTSTVGALLNGVSNGVAHSMPFIPLQYGDSGVRSIESVQLNIEDVGLFALILVKPLATIGAKQLGFIHEKDYFLNNVELPEIKDDAFLGMLIQPTASLASTAIIGNIRVIFN